MPNANSKYCRMPGDVDASLKHSQSSFLPGSACQKRSEGGSRASDHANNILIYSCSFLFVHQACLGDQIVGTRRRVEYSRGKQGARLESQPTVKPLIPYSSMKWLSMFWGAFEPRAMPGLRMGIDEGSTLDYSHSLLISCFRISTGRRR